MKPTHSVGKILGILAVVFIHHSATAVPVALDLGSVPGFGGPASAGSAVAGPGNATAVLGNGVLSAANYTWDTMTQKAKMDLGTANLNAAGSQGTVLSGAMSPTGVYGVSNSFGIGGVLTPNPAGGPNATGSSQAGSAPITVPGGGVQLTGAATPAVTNNILTLGAVVEGWVPFGDDGVALDGNGNGPSIFVTAVEVPDTGSAFFLFPFGLVTLQAFGAKFKNACRTFGGGRTLSVLPT